MPHRESVAGGNGQENMTGMGLREQSERQGCLVADAVSSRYRGMISKIDSVSER